MIIDHRHDDQRKDAEKTDVVEDRDDNDADEGEWVERIQQPECHDASIPIVNHNTAMHPLSTTTLCGNTAMQYTYKHALKITDFRNSTLNTLHMFNMQSVR